MITYYVYKAADGQAKIATSLINPEPGSILAEFAAGEPVTPFNALTCLNDGYQDELAVLVAGAEARAIAFVEALDA